jgi:hypothetical protein
MLERRETELTRGKDFRCDPEHEEEFKRRVEAVLVAEICEWMHRDRQPDDPIPLYQVLVEEYAQQFPADSTADMVECIADYRDELRRQDDKKVMEALLDAFFAWVLKQGEVALLADVYRKILERYNNRLPDRESEIRDREVALSRAATTPADLELRRDQIAAARVTNSSGWSGKTQASSAAGSKTYLYSLLIEEAAATFPKGAELRQEIKDKRRSLHHALLLARFYAYLHEKDIARSALCLSGGGTRSATFSLGIVQGLARHKVLEKFDFLSTVSGGGYLGAWLSAWIHRESREKVAYELRKVQIWPPGEEPVSDPNSPLNPEPEPVRHLRAYSRYLSPRAGHLSVDTWSLLGIYLRNLLLNWLVLLPLAAAALAFPRLLFAVFEGTLNGSRWLQYGLLIGAVVCGGISTLYLFGSRPSLQSSRFPGRMAKQKWYLTFCLLPLLLGSWAAATYFASLYRTSNGHLVGPATPVDLRSSILFALAVGLLGFVLSRFWVRRFKWSWLLEHLMVVLISAFAGWMLAEMAWLFNPTTIERYCYHMGWQPSAVVALALYTCLAVPLFMLVFLTGGVLWLGLASYYTNDADREWYARSGSLSLLAILLWIVLCGTVLFGPLALTASPMYSGILKGLGGVSGLISLLLGKSSKTAAGSTRESRQGASKAADVAVRLAAPLFLLFLMSLLSLGTNKLLLTWAPKTAKINSGTTMAGAAGAVKPAPVVTKYELRGALQLPQAAPGRAVSSSLDLRLSFEPRQQLGGLVSQGSAYLATLPKTSGDELLVLILAFLAGGGVASLFININNFSLHAGYRDRLIRAYLGASRRKSERQPNPFSGFDERDNLKMKELRGCRPFHVVNIALNLVGGKDLAWQDRKAETFTVSPLHAGNIRLGYRDSAEYGRHRRPAFPRRRGSRRVDGEQDRAISLGTAMAISGAAASPNMGYHSSPLVTFLLTLFNVRLGWWLGNPGPAGKRTYDYSGPKFGPRPIVNEALGLTDDQNPYVYLSDGGHFENLGLYEMVIRRCRYVLVSDASEDESFSFSDLGNALAKARIDLGVPIEIEKVLMRQRAPQAPFYETARDVDTKATVPYFALGRIRYSCVDPDAKGKDGYLVYVKSSLNGSEPLDVLFYARSGAPFPHDSTADVMFSESQFESYRALGSHITNSLCGGERGTLDLPEFFERLWRPTPGPVSRLLSFLGIK